MNRTAHQPARGLSNLRLKIIGIVLTVLSCVSGVIFPAGINIAAQDVSMSDLTAAVICEAMSWIAVPIYAWLLVDGYRHTRSIPAYAMRLLALAVIAEVPYDLATTGTPLDWGSQNPVFALFIAVIALALIDAFADRTRAVRMVIGAIVVAAALAWMVLGHIGLRQQIMNTGVLLLLILVLVFRYMAARENTMMMVAAACSALFCVLPAFGVALLHYRNGNLGYNRTAAPWVQWLFYALYPAVLLLFAIL
ncbi:TraX family protein [Bifidobacterium oedipodis]|uniref:ABC transporter permease n=1 Tax=Bifidobacterium oedipodis TaxID=2675322 RepID=A0A7Y0ER51_9BIFI|nr:TraX family protein [Bifidobacterium sp. DSM 109957]NMM94870.1 ABC transporter permease [Bifidobacterium sp. DSM 109957]